MEYSDEQLAEVFQEEDTEVVVSVAHHT